MAASLMWRQKNNQSMNYLMYRGKAEQKESTENEVAKAKKTAEALK